MTRVPRASLVAVVVAVAIGGGLAIGHDAVLARALENLELATYDARFRVRGPEPAKGEIVLVALDDKTLSEAPALLQKRAGVAAVIDAVHAAGAKVIGVDVIFSEPESPLAPALSDDVRAFVDGPSFVDTPDPAASLLRRVSEETRGDDVLERSLAAATTVLALHGSGQGTTLDDVTIRRARYGQLGAAQDDGAIRSAARLLTSLPRFTRAASGAGLVTIELDDDQVGRRLAVARRHEGAVLAPLAVHVAARMLDLSPAQIGYVPGDAIALGATRVPVTSSSSGDALLLRFRGPRGSFPTHSAVDVVNGRLPVGALEGKAVLIGFTYLSHDVLPTPFDGGASGLEVHAAAIDNLLANDGLRRAPAIVDGAWALVLGLLSALSFSRFGPQKASLRLAGSATLVVIAAVVGQVAFARGVWIAVAGPAVSALLASSAALVAAYLTEGAERRRLRKAFAHYLADEIIDELMSNPQALALGGARRDVTLLFSDIRGFTTLSEKMAPEALSRFLNAYLTPMTRAVLKERGFLDKYVGDALMAVYGAPAPSADHPDRALASALEMHTQLAILRDSLDASLNIGVGVNTGEAVAGNMGSDERFDYTVIGDAVNLASRLEGLTKRYGVFCIVGDETRKRASAGFSFRELDLVRVKGRGQPVAIHELLAGPGHAVVRYVDEDATFARATAAFRAGRFDEARIAFTAFFARNPSDPVAALYLERLASLGGAVPENWDGVFDHVEK